MKKLLAPATLSVLVLYCGCSDDKPTAPEPESNHLEATATIGTDGGTLSASDFILTVPSGAFAADVELKLYSVPDDDLFGENSATRSFRLEGLPDDFSMSLGLCIKYLDSLRLESYVGFGERWFVPSLADTQTVYRMIPADDSADCLVVEIPARDTLGASAKPLVSGMSSADDEEIPPIIKFIRGVTSYETFTSPNFYFACPEFMVDIPMTAYLENANSTFELMGFNRSYDGVEPFTNHIDISIEYPYEESGPGYAFTPTFADKRLFYLRFNPSEFYAGTSPEYPEYRPTIGRVLFDIFPNIYDVNYELPGHYWLHQAVGLWSEELFTDLTNYVPEDFHGSEMAPFNGMIAGAGSDKITALYHGYGMAPVIKYLVDRGEKISGYDQLLSTMYQRIFNNVPLTTAVTTSLEGEVYEWWPDFFKEYVGGNIYDVPVDTFIANAVDARNITSAGDTLFSFSGSYPDLSAKIYAIGLDYADMTESATLNLSVSSSTVTEQDMRVVVFAVKPGVPVQYVGMGADVAIPGLKDLNDQGYELLAVVANARNEAPYTGTSNITLEVTMSEGDVLSLVQYGTIVFGMIQWYEAIDPDTCPSQYPSGATSLFSFSTNDGSFEGLVFAGAWNSTSWTGDFRYEGQMTITLNESLTSAQFVVTETITDLVYGCITNRTITGTGITAVTPEECLLKFEVSGSSICTENLTMESRRDCPSTNCDYILGDYTCYSNALLTITLR